MKCLVKRSSLFISAIIFLAFGCSSFQGIRNIREIDENLNNGSFTVMTYNIRVGCGGENWEVSPHLCKSSKKNLLQIAEAIRSIDPDVIGLQEVKGGSQARFLGEKLNLNYAYRHHPNGWWGLAILSKFKILESHAHTIHRGPQDPRIGLQCVISVGGNPLNFLNVHYHLGEYESQVAASVRAMDRMSGPIFLVGDLNRPPWYRELKPIKNRLIDTCLALSNEKSRLIDQAGTGHGRIDYVFADPKSFEVVDVGLVLGEHVWTSDHLAYFARVAFK